MDIRCEEKETMSTDYVSDGESGGLQHALPEIAGDVSMSNYVPDLSQQEIDDILGIAENLDPVPGDVLGSKLYVGITGDGARYPFYSDTEPAIAVNPEYRYCIGPFDSWLAAMYAAIAPAACGGHVDDAHRRADKLEDRIRFVPGVGRTWLAAVISAIEESCGIVPDQGRAESRAADLYAWWNRG